MKTSRHHRLRLLGIGLSVLLLALPALGQGTDQPSEGVNSGNYNIRQSVEFGGRIADFDGNQGTYNSFVNLYSGPRLLDYSLEMHSLNHHGALFDSLSIFTFGYGGDPNALTRIRASKNKWYNFTALFRYDRNSWDYDLLVNPLNPGTSNPTILIGFSPHTFQTTRRIGNYDLTLFPQSRVRVRLGLSRTTATGLSFSTIHEGTEALLDQNWRTTQNTFHMGVDFRFLPHTNISYDQFLGFYKGDTLWGLDGLPFHLAGGVPVDLGLIFNTGANQPCGTPFLAPGFPTGNVNPSCNAYLAYSRFAPVRTFIPTEQLSLQGTYWNRVDVSARFNYSNSEMKNPLSPEFFNGLSSRTRTRQDTVAGLGLAQRIQGAFDFGVTVRASDRLRISDTFRWFNYHIPGFWNGVDSQVFGTSLLVAPNVFNPVTCPPPFVAATCPQHSSSSGPDISAQSFARFLGQELTENTIQFDYDFTPRVGFHAGYRYSARYVHQWFFDTSVETFFPTLPNRGDCAGQPLDANGICTVTILDTEDTAFPLNENTGLLGFWARPTDSLSINFDTELTAVEQKEIDRDPSSGWAVVSTGIVGPTRITPRNVQRYNFRARYTPAHWATLTASLSTVEMKNRVADINYSSHNPDISVTATLAPRDRFSLDLAYNYNHLKTSTNICYVQSPLPTLLPPCGGTYVSNVGFYDSTQHFGSVNLMFKPVKRVTTTLGYTLTSVDGNQLLINVLQPVGPLRSNYHLPSASILVDITQHIIFRGAWNYYDYNEKGDFVLTDPTGSLRDFHANVGTLALRYTF